MASHHQPNQVRNSSMSSQDRRGLSKAQMCLQKILCIISSFSPHETSEKPLGCGVGNTKRALLCEDEGRGVDLNIGSVPPPEYVWSTVDEGLSAFRPAGGEDGGRVFVVEKNDLSAVSAGVSMDGKRSEGECVLKKEEEEEEKLAYGSDSRASGGKGNKEEESAVVEEKVTELLEITKLQVQSLEINRNGDSEETKSEEENKIEAQQKEEEDGTQKERGGDGHLGLLIEAAKLIFGDFIDDEFEPEKPNENHLVRRHEFGGEEGRELAGTQTATDKSRTRRVKLKRNQRWMVDLYGEFEDDTSPVVRSKRGRSQVLPYKYRDSVLEPLTRLPRPRSTTLSPRRRSR